MTSIPFHSCAYARRALKSCKHFAHLTFANYLPTYKSVAKRSNASGLHQELPMAPTDPVHVDRFGAVASTLCATHCVACAVLPTVLTVGLGALLSPTFEWASSWSRLIRPLALFQSGARSPIVSALLVLGITGLLSARLMEGEHAHHHEGHRRQRRRACRRRAIERARTPKETSIMRRAETSTMRTTSPSGPFGTDTMKAMERTWAVAGLLLASDTCCGCARRRRPACNAHEASRHV